jgi:hypothetical protein
MRKEIVLSLAELRRGCLTCPHCATEVVLDFGTSSAAQLHGIGTSSAAQLHGMARYTPPGPGVTARRMGFRRTIPAQRGGSRRKERPIQPLL